jgi:hypothetical protein
MLVFSTKVDGIIGEEEVIIIREVDFTNYKRKRKIHAGTYQHEECKNQSCYCFIGMEYVGVHSKKEEEQGVKRFSSSRFCSGEAAVPHFTLLSLLLFVTITIIIILFLTYVTYFYYHLYHCIISFIFLSISSKLLLYIYLISSLHFHRI